MATDYESAEKRFKECTVIGEWKPIDWHTLRDNWERLGVDPDRPETVDPALDVLHMFCNGLPDLIKQRSLTPAEVVDIRRILREAAQCCASLEAEGVPTFGGATKFNRMHRARFMRLLTMLDPSADTMAELRQERESIKKAAADMKDAATPARDATCKHCGWEHDPACTSFEHPSTGEIYRVNVGTDPHTIIKALHDETTKSGRPQIDWTTIELPGRGGLEEEPRNVFKHYLDVYRALVLTSNRMMRLLTPDESRGQPAARESKPKTARQKPARKPARKRGKRRPA